MQSECASGSNLGGGAAVEGVSESGTKQEGPAPLLRRRKRVRGGRAKKKSGRTREWKKKEWKTPPREVASLHAAPVDEGGSVAPDVVTLDARKHADLGIGDEAPGDARPARVGFETGVMLVVPLGREPGDLREPGPGDVGEVVVLVVVADVVGQ